MVNIDPAIVILRKGRQVFLDHFDALLFAGMMSQGMRTILVQHIEEQVTALIETDNTQNEDVIDEVDNALASIDTAEVQSIVLDVLFMMVASPEFMVQR